MKRIARALCVTLAVHLGACIGSSPEQQAEADLGPEQPGVDHGPRHRPGQPCLTCHGADHTPGEEVFVIAGTILGRADDARGLEGARVEFEDDAGRTFTARTNRAGNFYVRVDSGLSEPRLRGDGELKIPWRPEFPLRVTVREGDREQTMRGLIWREGSCAACHGGPPSTHSNGPIYLEPQVQP